MAIRQNELPSSLTEPFSSDILYIGRWYKNEISSEICFKADVEGDREMSHVFQLSDEQYATLAAYAAQHAQTPETLFETWVNEVIHNIEPFSSSSLRTQERREGHEEEPIKHPLLEVAGMFAIGEPNWADKHDEYLAEVYGENHANNQ